MWRLLVICGIILFGSPSASGEEVLKIEKQIMRHEGFESMVYKCPAGKLTVGFGRNLESKGITLDEAKFLLRNDIAECEADLHKIFGNSLWELSDSRRYALIDLRFNLGPTGFRNFKRMIAAIKAKNFNLAALELSDSLWYKQVGDRGKCLFNMILMSEEKMRIQDIGELKDYFRYSKNLLADKVFVNVKIRREWMLNHEIVIIEGTIYDLSFKDMGGGVWRATIVKKVAY